MLSLLSQADRASASEPHSDPDDFRVVTGKSINLFLRSVTHGDTAEQQEEMEMTYSQAKMRIENPDAGYSREELQAAVTYFLSRLNVRKEDLDRAAWLAFELKNYA
jgi:hypothetical protein